jgi:hypothetical protein
MIIERQRSFYAGKPDRFLTAIFITGYVVAAVLTATMGIASYIRLG